MVLEVHGFVAGNWRQCRLCDVDLSYVSRPVFASQKVKLRQLRGICGGHLAENHGQSNVQTPTAKAHGKIKNIKTIQYIHIH